MLKKLLTFSMLILIIIGLGIGIYFSVFSKDETQEEKARNDAIFGSVQTKSIEVTEFFTFGKCFNFSGKLSSIAKDNFESAKLYLTDGNGFEKNYSLDGKIEEGNLHLTTTNQINTGLILDELSSGNYVILVRLKMNNSIEPKYYSLSNHSEYGPIEYYTITNQGTNRKIKIDFKEKSYQGKEYAYLNLDIQNIEKKPEEVYDFVIDAGHGGKDVGEKSGTDTEENITLLYAKQLKEKLENQGLKVKLTRDDLNTNSYTATNMYDDNGRISIACQSKAKYMISFHINNGNKRFERIRNLFTLQIQFRLCTKYGK